MNETGALRSFTDADLRVTLTRAMRTVAVLGVVLFGVFCFAGGWRAGMLLLTGAVVSMASLFEWRRLVAVLNARMDNQQPPHSTSFVVTMFFLRIAVAGLVIYGSLKCFQSSIYGSPYLSIGALVAGLSLAFIALTIEAFRVLIL